MSKHLFRFFANKICEENWLIHSDDQHHLRKVLRLQKGDSVEVSDGCGRTGVGEIYEISESQIIVKVKEEKYVDRNKGLIIALGATKPKVLDATIPLLVELGADVIIVFRQLGSEAFRVSSSGIERWKRLIREETKQSKRPWEPQLFVFSDFVQFLNEYNFLGIENRFVCVPGVRHNILNVPLALSSTMVVVGNERGLDQDVLSSLFELGFSGVSLSNGILRAEVAAEVAVAVLSLRINYE